ncbi:MAG TPA: hypothetical protein V6C65_33785, partial [Allocoleopsis sp.]
LIHAFICLSNRILKRHTDSYTLDRRFPKGFLSLYFFWLSRNCGQVHIGSRSNLFRLPAIDRKG